MLRIARTPKGIVVTSDEMEDLRLGVTENMRIGDILIEVESFLANARHRHGTVTPDPARADSRI